MNLVLLGPPGSGKGTQSTRLSQEIGAAHISTGEIFREQIRKKTPLGLKAVEYTSSGRLVPDSVIAPMLEERLGGADCRNGFILDGYPRTIPQAELLDAALKRRGESLEGALLIDVPEAVCVERLSSRRSCSQCGQIYNLSTQPPAKPGICDRCGSALRQREDDKPETIKHRLEVYRAQTEPLIRYYEASRRLLRANGALAPDLVFKELQNLVKYKVS